jgi:hypothetical protein
VEYDVLYCSGGEFPSIASNRNGYSARQVEEKTDSFQREENISWVAQNILYITIDLVSLQQQGWHGGIPEHQKVIFRSKLALKVPQ